MISLVVWSSFIAAFPIMLLAFWLERPMDILAYPNHWAWASIGMVLYTTYISTHVGYGGWSWLLSRYDAAHIVPFALLSPIVAMSMSTVLFHESFEVWKMVAAILVFLGLGINMFGGYIFEQFFQEEAEESEPIFKAS